MGDEGGVASAAASFSINRYLSGTMLQRSLARWALFAGWCVAGLATVLATIATAHMRLDVLVLPAGIGALALLRSRRNWKELLGLVAGAGLGCLMVGALTQPCPPSLVVDLSSGLGRGGWCTPVIGALWIRVGMLLSGGGLSGYAFTRAWGGPFGVPTL